MTIYRRFGTTNGQYLSTFSTPHQGRRRERIASRASLPATRVQFGLSAVLQYSNTPSLRAAGFEDEDDDEDENEAPGERRFKAGVESG